MYPGNWLVAQIPRFSRWPAHRIKLKFGGWIHYSTPQLRLTFYPTLYNPCSDFLPLWLDLQTGDVHLVGGSMMTSSNENIFRVTGPLCGEVTGYRWIPHTKASDA